MEALHQENAKLKGETAALPTCSCPDKPQSIPAMFGKVAPPASESISKFQADVTKDKAITTQFVPAPSKLVPPASVESVGIFVGSRF